jgi:cytochrome c oxidase assembly protein subunit 11
MNPAEPQARESNLLLTAKLLAFALGMFAFGFLVLPPLYDVFCDITGFGGRSNGEAAAAIEQPDLTRSVRVEFITTVNDYAPWQFSADVDSMEVHPGKLYFATFTAKNTAPAGKVGQAVASIAPTTATAYFKKIECFCFESQQFAANEQRPLPLQFIVDPELPDYVDTITLSYTMFDTEIAYVTRTR